jgi:hypothetical protein
MTGRPGKLPLPVHNIASLVPAAVLAQVTQALSFSATGSAATMKSQFRAIVDAHQPDELLVTGVIHAHAARIRSFEIGADVLSQLCAQKRVA